jgi:hypothetical protein
MGNVRLPENDFRFRDEATDAWVAFLQASLFPNGREGRRIIPRVFDQRGNPALRGTRLAVPGRLLDWIEGDVFLRLSPMIAGQKLNPLAPVTAPGDLLLELHAYNSRGGFVFDIRRDRIVSKELFVDVFGPNLPMPAELADAQRGPLE